MKTDATVGDAYGRAVHQNRKYLFDNNIFEIEIVGDFVHLCYDGYYVGLWAKGDKIGADDVLRTACRMYYISKHDYHVC